MSTAIDSPPAEHRSVLIEVLRARDVNLLAALLSLEDRLAVVEIMSAEFSRHLQPDDEPTERGIAVDNALGVFPSRWPIEHE